MFDQSTVDTVDWSFDDLFTLVGDEHEHVARAVEVRLRVAVAEMAVSVASAERKQVWQADGHASVLGWARVATGEGSKRCNAYRLIGHALLDMPKLAAAAKAGELGLDQLELFGKAYANERCGHLLADYLEILIDSARTMSFSDFKVVLGRWQTLNDPDGAHDDAERVDKERKASLSVSDSAVTISAYGGTAAGVSMREVFDHFVQAEWEADWAEVRALHGEDANLSMMPRTDAQRRFDALLKVFLDAASTPPDAQAPDPLAQIVIDELTFEETVEAMFGVEVADKIFDRNRPPRDVRRCRDPRRRRCETLDGIPLDPYQAVAAILVGSVRRLVYNSAGVTINLGTRCRFFTGAARDAIMLSTRRCLWPGCEVPSGRCQADHSVEYSRHGPTDQVNGGPLCHRHNQWKNRGFKVWRDPDGNWHTYRPNGTEIC